ncbi:hypothetical protein Runsl_1767 [Runella slithyformis DSM 19594]|uniref:Uncharacterized protein n=1 Tax=Runella slithyformis (strain ATCC 29530 / DSM 19594 / LMG 11500 / NCIMB 11436 / LSU 4) TaxID=761193 RepID=A0A7U4E546_RUNSL|nr:hypothetical protein Runsl_1767 [Runella slithyformis DSM 19594]
MLVQLTSEWVSSESWVSTSIVAIPAGACEITQNQLLNAALEDGQLYVYAKIGDNMRPLSYTILK